MEERLISFNTARLSKESGFDWKVTHHYRDGGLYTSELINGGAPYNMNCQKEQDLWNCNLYSAPQQSLLQKWLRDEHNIEVLVYCNASGWLWELNKAFSKSWLSGGTHISWSDSNGPNESGSWEIYEEALEAGLLEAFKLIK